jgi:adenylate cyclase
MLTLSYVPYPVLADLLAHPGTNPVGRAERLTAVVLFADISGFTRLSEALGREGKGRTEELTHLINRFFERVIGHLETYGGVVGKMSGDAILAYFPYDSTTQQAVMLRAVKSALDIQADDINQSEVITTAANFALKMKIGLAAGNLLCLVVGIAGKRLEYVIAGEVVETCAEAEHRAQSGDVVAHESVFRQGTAVETRALDDAFAYVTGVATPVPPSPLPQLATASLASEPLIDSFLHRTLVQQIKNNLSDFINEHRFVTAMFVRFANFDEKDVEVTSRLQSYFEQVIEIIDRYDGYLNKIEMGDKGSKFLVLFGAPIAHENDAERALRCAVDLSKLAEVEVQIGVNTGFVYAGQFGSESRREYTVIGRAVNVAAQLMTVAEKGQILAGEETRRSTKRAFRWGDTGAIQIKGTSNTAFYAHLESIRERYELYEPGYRIPMVGREDEVALLREKIDLAATGRGQVIVLIGEAGIGKSRLAVEAVKLANMQDFAIFAGASQSWGQEVSYLVWHNIWRQFFEVGLNTAEPQTTVEAKLRQYAPRMLLQAPLLSAVLNVQLAENEFIKTLDTPSRTELFYTLLVEVLRQYARTQPILFVLEDTHWIDTSSAGLLQAVAQNIGDLPVAILVVQRPLNQAVEALYSLPYSTAIRVKNFSPAETRRLISFKLAQVFGKDIEEVPAALVHSITQKGQGNPFYVEEMVHYLRDKGRDGQSLDDLQQIEMPSTLHSLIISRIDQLTEKERTILKSASVIGRLFRASWLWRGLAISDLPDEVIRYLEDLDQRELTPLYNEEPELQYLFKHIVTQEVAYDSIPLALRKRLHEQLGEFVEQQYGEALVEYADILAYHFGQTDNAVKHKRYLRLAGDKAKSNFAIAAALNYFHRLLPLLNNTEQAEILREIGELLQMLGRWGEAETAFRTALALASQTDNRPETFRIQTALGYLLAHNSSPAASVEYLQQAKSGFEEIGDDIGRSKALEYLSFAYLHQGAHQIALEYIDEQLQLAAEHRDGKARCEALMYRAWIHADQGSLTEAEHDLGEALNLAHTLNYQRGIIHANSDIAGVFYGQGDLQRALKHAQESIEAATAIGYQRFVGPATGNCGELYRMYGDFDSALDCYSHALSIALQAGDLISVFYNLGNIAQAYTIQTPDERLRLREIYEQTIRLGQRLDLPYPLCEFIQSWAEVLYQQADFKAAKAVNAEALTVATEVSNQEVVFRSRVLDVQIKVALNEIAINAAIENFRTMMTVFLEDHQSAELHFQIWKLDDTQEDARQEAALLYERLYRQTPHYLYRENYRALTETFLAEPYLLPRWSSEVTAEALPALIARAATL